MNIFKSIGVIVLGFMVSALLSILTDYLLESIGVLSSPNEGLFITWMIVVVLFYRGVYTAVSGYIVARLAPSRPMLHAMILGIIGVAIVLIAIQNPEFKTKAPLWFGYALAAITLPCMWLGVKIQSNWNS